jgi:hypothetical protein
MMTESEKNALAFLAGTSVVLLAVGYIKDRRMNSRKRLAEKLAQQRRESAREIIDSIYAGTYTGAAMNQLAYDFKFADVVLNLRTI